MAAVLILDNDDDFFTARGKLEQIAETRISLVIPAQATLMYRSVTFQLLRRWSSDSARQILIVSRDPPLKRLVSDFGFDTVPSLRAAENYWRLQDKIAVASPVRATYLRYSGRIVRELLMMTAVVAVLSALVYFLLPETTVILNANTAEISQKVTITADTSAKTTDPMQAVIPARTISATIEASDRLPTTGKRELSARGFVTLANLTAASVTVPAGTVVTTGDGRKFTVTTALTIPAPRYSSVRTQVVATVPGRAGEALRLTINRVEGSLAGSVGVVNDQPILVDNTLTAVAVSEVDREKLRNSLFDRLSRQAVAAIHGQMKQYETLVIQTIETEVVREEFDRNVGDDAATLSLHLSLRSTGMVIDQRQAATVARQKVESTLAGSRQLVAQTIRMSPLELVSREAGKLVFTTQLDAVEIEPYDVGEISRLVAGVVPDEAATALQTRYHLDQPPEVTVSPSWAKSAFRVRLIVQD